jgi:hypothetical protein
LVFESNFYLQFEIGNHLLLIWPTQFAFSCIPVLPRADNKQ